MLKRTFFAPLALVVAFLSAFLGAPEGARAEMPQTDVQLVSQMDGMDSAKVLQALALYYDLHVSELIVQNMNEQRTGAMFAVQRAKAAGAPAQKITALEAKSKEVASERSAQIQTNQDLRVKLGELTGLDFAEPLVMAPDVPLDLQTEPPAARAEAWAALQKAHKAWQAERLVLLDAQQRYDETRDVPIGDHLRAMTQAEAALTKAVGAYRLVVARSAADAKFSIAEALGAL